MAQRFHAAAPLRSQEPASPPEGDGEGFFTERVLKVLTDMALWGGLVSIVLVLLWNLLGGSRGFIGQLVGPVGARVTATSTAQARRLGILAREVRLHGAGGDWGGIVLQVEDAWLEAESLREDGPPRKTAGHWLRFVARITGEGEWALIEDLSNRELEPEETDRADTWVFGFRVNPSITPAHVRLGRRASGRVESGPLIVRLEWKP